MEQSPTSATGIGWEHTFTTLRSGWRHLRCWSRRSTAYRVR